MALLMRRIWSSDQFPFHRGGGVADLRRPLRAAEGDGDAGLVDRPIDNHLGDAAFGFGGDGAQLVEEILVLLPLVALIHRILLAAVAGIELVIAAELAGEQALHQRPVDADGNSALAAPGENVGFDFALQHVVARLVGG